MVVCFISELDIIADFIENDEAETIILWDGSSDIAPWYSKRFSKQIVAEAKSKV
ncbi:hypothetical protein QFZ81_004963 [Paenibacillus sp. V4I9]|nr:hypothetical protein [Paenibacillus sp. V4I9]